MEDEYIIINKTAILKRIEESANKLSPTHILLKEILSQSTLLIPEIERAFDEGVNAIQENNNKLKVTMPKAKQEYISNLKLDI